MQIISILNVVSGVLLAEPLAGKLSAGLHEPVKKFNETLAPYRTAIGIADLGVGALSLAQLWGSPFYYSYFGAGYGQIILALVMGGLLAESVAEKFLPRSSFCEMLHEYQPYIGAGGVVVGLAGVLNF